MQPVEHLDTTRSTWVRRGQLLAWATIAWNSIEGIVGIASGLAAGSVILWRLAQERRGWHLSERAERRAVRLIAITFLLLAVGIGVESMRRLISGDAADESTVGIMLAVVSLVVMPLLARAKRRVGVALDSRAVQADATQTVLCVWLSAILLIGLSLNAIFGWWWADPIAALAIVYIAAREGIEHLRTGELADCC